MGLCVFDMIASLITVALVGISCVLGAPQVVHETTTIDRVIPGMSYASHVRLAGANEKRMKLVRRGGGGGNGVPTTTFVPTPAPTDLPAQTPGKLVYYGGPVISNVEITMLTWGDAKHADKFPGFYGAITQSSYWDMCKCLVFFCFFLLFFFLNLNYIKSPWILDAYTENRPGQVPLHHQAPKLSSEFFSHRRKRYQTVSSFIGQRRHSEAKRK